MKITVKIDKAKLARRLSREAFRIPTGKIFKAGKSREPVENDFQADPRIVLVGFNENRQVWKIDSEIAENRYGKIDYPATHERYPFIPKDEEWVIS